MNISFMKFFIFQNLTVIFSKIVESDRFKNAVEIKSKYNVVIYLNLS